MTRADVRLAGIGKRMRKRRLRALQQRRALEREAATSREAHLKMLAMLCGRLECGHFSEAELTDARAALLQPSHARQAQLPLRSGDRT